MRLTIALQLVCFATLVTAQGNATTTTPSPSNPCQDVYNSTMVDKLLSTISNHHRSEILTYGAKQLLTENSGNNKTIELKLVNVEKNPNKTIDLYIAPVSGYFYFNVKFLDSPNVFPLMTLWVNDALTMELTADGDAGNICGNSNARTHLNQGDRVQVKVNPDTPSGDTSNADEILIDSFRWDYDTALRMNSTVIKYIC